MLLWAPNCPKAICQISSRSPGAGSKSRLPVFLLGLTCGPTLDFFFCQDLTFIARAAFSLPPHTGLASFKRSKSFFFEGLPDLPLWLGQVRFWVRFQVRFWVRFELGFGQVFGQVLGQVLLGLGQVWARFMMKWLFWLGFGLGFGQVLVRFWLGLGQVYDEMAVIHFFSIKCPLSSLLI